LTDTSKRGTRSEFPAITSLPGLATKQLDLGGEGLETSPALGFATNGSGLGGEVLRTSPTQGFATNDQF